MRTRICTALFLCVPMFADAAETLQLQKANINLHDQSSLQHGAQYFLNYCFGCHSLKYMRYNRLAKDLQIDDVTLHEKMLVGDTKSGDLMENAMHPEDSLKWFGVVIPDLTLVTRWRSPDYVYTYLKSFYRDDTRPFGVNNLVFPLVGMPFALGDMQGVQEAVFAPSHEAGAQPVIEKLTLVRPGILSPEQYDAMVRDITAFLTYAGEPIRLERERLGIYVLLFLSVLFVLTYLLKKEYWKDVH